jgi:hypothetical protein
VVSFGSESVCAIFAYDPDYGVGPSVEPSTVGGTLAVAVPTDGCVELDDLHGKIILMDRGNCSGFLKAVNAYVAFATAVIIINNEMGEVSFAGNFSALEEFPVLSVTQTDGAKLKRAAGTQASIRLGVHPQW